MLFRNVTRPVLSMGGRCSGYEANQLSTKSPTVLTRGPTRRIHTLSARNCPVSGTPFTHPLNLGFFVIGSGAAGGFAGAAGFAAGLLFFGAGAAAHRANDSASRAREAEARASQRGCIMASPGVGRVWVRAASEARSPASDPSRRRAAHGVVPRN